MREIRFFHCADVHLDTPFTSLGANVEKSTIRRMELKRTFERLIGMVDHEKPDLLLISGDLYEHDYIKRPTLQFLNDCFSRIPDTTVVILPGNHDPYTVDSYYRMMDWTDNVHLLCRQHPFFCFPDMGVAVYGAGFDDPSLEQLKQGQIRPENPEWVNILMFHGTVDLNIGRRPFNAISSAALESTGMDYIALGHFHNRIEGAGTRGIVFNPGSLEPLGFDEPGEHGLFSGTVLRDVNGSKSLAVEFVPISCKFYEKAVVPIDGCRTDEQTAERIMASISGRDPENGLFSITLKGATADGYTVNPDRLRWYLDQRLFYIKIEDETFAGYDIETMKDEPGLKGLFARRILARMDETQDEHRKKLLMKAFHYGLQALEQGKVDID